MLHTMLHTNPFQSAVSLPIVETCLTPRTLGPDQLRWRAEITHTLPHTDSIESARSVE